jgi:hypothetical protein
MDDTTQTLGKILEPGRPGDLLMIFRTALEAVEALKNHSFETGDYDQNGMNVIADTICQAIQMWRGEIPVVETPFKGLVN